ncbi:MAG: hypothetical protein LBQ79_07340 [Deltaproteobacteria bacterium]|nr:hypothetical protein [Deltaproteobacteria bacterium]
MRDAFAVPAAAALALAVILVFQTPLTAGKPPGTDFRSRSTADAIPHVPPATPWPVLSGADLFSGTQDEGAYRAYLDSALAAAAFEAERSRLETKLRTEGLTPEESKRLAELPWLIAEAKAAFMDLLKRLKDFLGSGTGDPVPDSMELTFLHSQPAGAEN